MAHVGLSEEVGGLVDTAHAELSEGGELVEVARSALRDWQSVNGRAFSPDATLRAQTAASDAIAAARDQLTAITSAISDVRGAAQSELNPGMRSMLFGILGELDAAASRLQTNVEALAFRH